MSVRIHDSRRPPRSPALPISSGSSSPSRHMSSSPSSSGIMMISPSSSPSFKPPSNSKGCGSEQKNVKMTLGKNYAAFQKNSHDLLLLHRQQSVDGRRSKQKRLAVPSRSHSLKHQRFSSSLGHLDRRASVVEPKAAAGRNETTVYFVDHHHLQSFNNNNEDDDSGGDKGRQMNPVLNIPSRQASVRSYGSGKSVISSPLSRGNSSRRTGGDSSRISACSQQAFPISYDNNNSLLAVASEFPWKHLPSKERRHRKVACAVFIFSSFLLASAIVCTLVSLHRSPHIDEKVRKENEHLLKSIQQTATSYNATTSTTTGSTTLQSEDTLNNNSNNNSNNNNSFNIVNSKSLPRTTDSLNNNQGVDEDYNGNNDEARKENKMILDGTADNADQ